MTRTILTRIALIAMTAAALYFVATAPALWWMPEAARADLIAQAEQQHGTDAANYLRKVAY